MARWLASYSDAEISAQYWKLHDKVHNPEKASVLHDPKLRDETDPSKVFSHKKESYWGHSREFSTYYAEMKRRGLATAIRSLGDRG